jgi:transposase-like protein
MGRLPFQKWTRSQPIRTAAEIPFSFSLLRTQPPFAYQRVTPVALQMHRLGMSAVAIAQALGVSDKTITKAIRRSSR